MGIKYSTNINPNTNISANNCNNINYLKSAVIFYLLSV